MLRKLMLVGAMALLAGCATITRGTKQTVVISTEPAGADCRVERNGAEIGRANPTPQAVSVSKSKSEITITCDKAGYKTAIHNLPSDVELMTAGNLILGGFIGLAVDAGTGAMNKYDANVRIRLLPN